MLRRRLPQSPLGVCPPRVDWLLGAASVFSGGCPHLAAIQASPWSIPARVQSYSPFVPPSGKSEFWLVRLLVHTGHQNRSSSTAHALWHDSQRRQRIVLPGERGVGTSIRRCAHSRLSQHVAPTAARRPDSGTSPRSRHAIACSFFPRPPGLMRHQKCKSAKSPFFWGSGVFFWLSVYLALNRVLYSGLRVSGVVFRAPEAPNLSRYEILPATMAPA